MSFMSRIQDQASRTRRNRSNGCRDQRSFISSATELQTAKLLKLDSMCERLFSLLQHEKFRSRDREAPFELPVERLITVSNLGRQALRRRLLQLQAGGLISIIRRHRKPPLIMIL